MAFLSWCNRTAVCASTLAAMASTPALAAPIDIHWPEITFTWPPSAPDMLLIGSGLVLVLVLLFALMRGGTNARQSAAAPKGPDLRWWKNPPEPPEHGDPISMPH